MKTKRILAIVIVLAMVLSLAPAAFAADNTVTIWEGSASAGGNWWDYVLTANVDGSVLTEGGSLSVYHDIQYPGLNVILGGASNGWAQVTAGAAVASGDGYVTQIDYATLLAAYGAADLSDVTSINIYVSTGETATVTNISYTAAGEDGGEEEEPAVSYNATLDVDWWIFDYQTVTPGQTTTFTVDVSALTTMNHFAISIADAYADLKDLTPYLLVKVDGETVHNGACAYWAEWVDGVESNNYYIEPYNAWNDSRDIASVPAGSELTVTLSLGEPIVEEEAPATYVVAGEAALCGTEWDASNTDNLMTDEDGDGIYTKVYENLAEGWPQFKVVEILPDGTQNWLTDKQNDENMWVEAKEGDTLTITYEPATGTITYAIEDAPPPTYVVAGEAALCGSEWDATDEANLMTDEDGDGVYTKIYRNAKEGWPQFKVVEVQARGTQTWLTDAENGTDNMWLETKAGDTVVITYEPATGEITYKRYRIYENAYLCCADDGWWPLVNMESDYKVSTTVTGSGTYTLRWNLNEWGWDAVNGLAVLYIDIENYDMIQMYDVANVVVTVDGQSVPVTQSNVKTYESDGYYRIELYNMYSGTAGAVSGDLAFAENVTVTFDLVYTASHGDETNLVLMGSLLVVSMLGIVALIVTKKKFA